MPFLTVAWWAAKWTLTRTTGGNAKAALLPWLTPWVVVPVIIAATLVFAHLSIRAAEQRGDAAGYARKTAEVDKAVAASNGRIAGGNAATATTLALNDAARARLVADIRRESLDLLAEKDRRLTAKNQIIDELKDEVETVSAAKVRTVGKPIVKIKTIVREVKSGCGVGDLMAAKLNGIQ